MTIAMPATIDLARMCHIAWTGFVSIIPRGRGAGQPFPMDGRNSLVSFILKSSDRETFWAQFGNTKMDPNDTFGLVSMAYR